MSESPFASRHTDLSTETAFRFEFYCALCDRPWTAPPERYVPGTVAKVVGETDRVFGGLFSSAGAGLGAVRGAAWEQARAEALARATEAAERHFRLCPRCGAHVCEGCWHPSAERCAACLARRGPAPGPSPRRPAMPAPRAPDPLDDLDAEIVVDPANLCPGCGTDAGGARFCPHCGAKQPEAS